jgi:hypothetical protein
MTFLQQMAQEHGNSIAIEGLTIFEDGFKLLGSGARGDGMYQMIEPEDDLAKLRAQRDYVAALLDKEEKDWFAFKSECMTQAQLHLTNPSSCPSAPHDAADQLQAGKERIEALRSNLATIDEQLPDNKINERQEEREQHRYADALKHRNEIASVEL